MIEPFQRDDQFVADANQPLEENELRVWWLGQSGFFVRIGNRRLILDPYLSDSLTAKYAGTDKPHVRMTRRVIAPERLEQIDVVTSSHAHTDHLDAETLKPLYRSNPRLQLIIPEANRDLVADRLGIPRDLPIGLDDGTTASVAGFESHGIAAAHNELELDGLGRHRFLGYVVRCGSWSIYHSGDTVFYPTLPEKLRRFAVDLALLPINGDLAERRVAGNLDGREAAQLAHAIGARWVVPCHYEMFAFNTADPADLFIPECTKLGQPFRILRAGAGWTVPPRSSSS